MLSISDDKILNALYKRLECSEDTFNYWTDTGIIDIKLPEETRRKIADIFTKYLRWVSDNPEKLKIACGRSWNFEILPIIHRVISGCPEENITDIESFYSFIIEFLRENYDYYEKLLRRDCDAEATMVGAVVDTITNIIKDGKESEK